MKRLVAVVLLTGCWLFGPSRAAVAQKTVGSEIPALQVPGMVQVEGKTLRAEAYVLRPEQKALLQFDTHSEAYQKILRNAISKTPGDQAYPLDQPTRIGINILWEIDWRVPAGGVAAVDQNSLNWVAPATPGNYPVSLRILQNHSFENIPPKMAAFLGGRQTAAAECDFMMLVQYPFDAARDSKIENYTIGIYPNENDENVSPYVAVRRKLYHPPQWFIKLTPQVADLHISPHFRLRDFAPTADLDQGPVFIAISFRLVDRLEAIVRALNAAGRPVKTLAIFRGFIPPNQILRMKRQGANFSEFTRHQYGDAAAFYVDADGDGRMDDLNRDGVIDVKDAEYLGAINDKVERESGKYGGMGIHGEPQDSLSPHTPYLEIDLRGSQARW